MANDAHKLIAVSLGKIAQARQCKSGLNLRRNLLVASVLHRARYIYVSELRQRQYHAQQSEPQAATDQGCYVSGSTGTVVQSDSQQPADEMVVDEQPCREDPDPSPPAARPERTFNKENTPPPHPVETTVPLGGDAIARCAVGGSTREDSRRPRKRTASDGSDLAVSPDDASLPSANKRCKGSSDNGHGVDDACQPLQPCCDATTLVDPVQINNLVQIFNASLTNLTTEQHGKGGDGILQPSPSAAPTACASELKDCTHAFGRETMAVTA